MTRVHGPQPPNTGRDPARRCRGRLLRPRAAQPPGPRGTLWAVVAGAALMAWMRPTDAVWVSVPLLVLAAAWRRPRLLAALVGGRWRAACPG
ncbi:Integral membrane protein OS=Streptomyces tendae OX=1932 GN=F3L20_17015 PE=4 SV=1 [Streptomyces tendae]